MDSSFQILWLKFCKHISFLPWILHVLHTSSLIWWGVHIIKLLTMQPFPPICYFPSLRSKIFLYSSNSFSLCSSWMAYNQVSQPYAYYSYTTHLNTAYIYVFTKSKKLLSVWRKSHLFYAYWTVHHLDIWIKVDQLDDTCFIIYCSTCFRR